MNDQSVYFIKLLIELGALPSSIYEYSYEELPYEYRKYIDLLSIVNGCGGKGGIIPVPELRFNHCCNCHDWDYLRGGTEEDKKIADSKFLKRMIGKSNELPIPRRWFTKLMSYVYYFAVCTFGRKFFNFK